MIAAETFLAPTGRVRDLVVNDGGNIQSDYNGTSYLFRTDGLGNVFATSFNGTISGPIISVATLGASGTDITTALQAAVNGLTSGGVIYIPSGYILVTSSPITVNNAKVRFRGDGFSSLWQPSASFVGAQIINFTADYCSIDNLLMQYASSSTATNPAADGICFSGAKHCLAWNLEIYYINGQAVNATASSISSNASLVLYAIHGFNNASGVMTKGHTNQNFLCQHKYTNVDMERVTSGNAFDFIDCADVACANLFGASNGASGNTVNIQGKVSALLITGGDLGVINTGTQSCVIIQDGTSGSPTRVFFTNCVIQQGLYGLQVTGAATQWRFHQCSFRGNQNDGVNLSGTTSSFALNGCTFSTNGIQNNVTPSYDVNSSTSGEGSIENCQFLSSIGAAANQVTNPLNVTAGSIDVVNGRHSGTNHSLTNFYNGAPKTIFGSVRNFLPQGLLASQPAVPSSNTNTTALPFDTTFLIVGGTVSDIQVNNSSTGLSLTAGIQATIFVPRGQSIKVVYTVAPTWKVFG